MAVRLPNRKYTRARWHEYNGATYFATICTHNMIDYFGRVDNGEMILSDIGRIVDTNIRSIPEHHDNVDVPLWVVMPNHLHVIIIIDKVLPSLTMAKVDMSDNQNLRRFVTSGGKRELLSVVVGNLKASVTRAAHIINPNFGWQSRFYDRIVRTWDECNMIAEYIVNNPLRWETDCFYADKN